MLFLKIILYTGEERSNVLVRQTLKEDLILKKKTDLIRTIAEKMDWPPHERADLKRLMEIFASRNCPEDPHDMFPRFDTLKRAFLDSLDRGDADDVERAFLTLYCHVHGHEAPYTPDERDRLDRAGGYWCHAGGISPILKARPYLHPHATSVDLGAGNGLQCLLLQKLYPHKKTIQVELSSKMVDSGRHLATWLNLPANRVEWRVGDVRDFSPQDADFIYLYRPMRPTGPGKTYYERLARQLDAIPHRVTIFSIADCLAPFLSPRFHKFYGDGHLTCFENQAL